jgi:hypothetical protein
MGAEELTVHTLNLRLDGEQTTSMAPLFAADGIEKGEAFTPLPGRSTAQLLSRLDLQ